MLEKYLDHQPISRCEAWGLEVSPISLDTPHYREIFAKKTGLAVPKDPDCRMKYWTDVMQPALYKEFSVQW